METECQKHMQQAEHFPPGKKNNTHIVWLGFAMTVKLQDLKCKRERRCMYDTRLIHNSQSDLEQEDGGK